MPGHRRPVAASVVSGSQLVREDRVMNRLCIVLIVLILVALNAAPTFAQEGYLNPYSSPIIESHGMWSGADRCAATAWSLFPDYTPQGNVARENYRRACLRAPDVPAPNGQARVSDWSTK
jgi:hypothetical protein